MKDKTKIYKNDVNKIEAGRKRRIGSAFKAAFPHTIPIFAGFWFIGLAYGIYECLGVQFLVSDDNEPYHICRVDGIRRGKSPAGKF